MEVPAVVTEYDPRWPGVLERLRDRLDAALAGVAHVTEHVGSTAVRGLAAKPIIDMDVAYVAGKNEMITEFLRMARAEGATGASDPAK